MELRRPESRCEDSPVRAHHYFRMIGGIWRCRYCWRTVWLPATLGEAVALGYDIGRIGIDRAYQKHLQGKPETKQLLAKLEEIRLLRKVLPEDELMMAIAAITLEKEVEIEEEIDYSLAVLNKEGK